MQWRNREKWDDKEHHEKASFFSSKWVLESLFFFLRKHVLHLLWSLANCVLGVLACSHASGVYVLACSRAWRVCALTCLRAYVFDVLACFRVWCACMRACLLWWNVFFSYLFADLVWLLVLLSLHFNTFFQY